MMFVSLRGMSAPDEYKEHLDQLDLASVVMTPYADHHHVCPFQEVNLHSGWLIYGTRKVRYLSERVLHLFRYIQIVPRFPNDSADVQITLG